LRRQNQEQATAGSVADVTALRRELVEINTVFAATQFQRKNQMTHH
jgi:hypothetical protein